MDRYREEAIRSSSVDNTTATKYKRRNYITGKKVLEVEDRKLGVKKIM